MIEPALTAEEWAEGRFKREGGTDVVGWRVDVQSFARNGSGWLACGCEYPTHNGLKSHHNIQAEWLPELIALANAALPDDDPRKLVAADLKAIRFILERASFWDEGPSGEGWPSPEMEKARDLLESLADRIAALLPPEPESK